MSLTKILGFGLMALVLNVEASRVDELVNEANETIANFIAVRNDAHLIVDIAFNSSISQIEAFLDAIPAQYPIDEPLADLAELKKKAEGLGADISSCLEDNVFENIQQQLISLVTTNITDVYHTVVNYYQSEIDDVPAVGNFSISACLLKDFGEPTCLIQLITEVKLATLKVDSKLRKLGYLMEDTLREYVVDNWATMVNDNVKQFQQDVEFSESVIFQCAQDIFDASSTTTTK